MSIRLRLTFSKSGPLKYSSHLDLMRVWERALRRAEVPLAYSGGYNPRPKLQLARALPLGHSAENEILDIWLEDQAGEQGSRGAEEFIEKLAPVLPEGLMVKEVRSVDPKGPAMQTQVVATTYRVAVVWEEPAEEVEARIEQALAAEELPHERRGKRYNLRPLIEELRLEAASGGEVVLTMQLSARPGATGRPEAVVDVLGMGDAFARYTRTALVLKS
jgi:radical SAM-linked protein